MMERLLADYISPDLHEEIMYGYDQVCINHPEVFATVNFYLNSTVGLDRIVDQMRIEKGFLPVLMQEDYSEYDDTGWYNFYIGLNEFNETHVDSAIEVIVQCPNSEDNEDVYYIDLTPDEQRMIYDVLNDACVSYLGKSCEDLLNEAHEEMELCLKEEPYTASI